MAGRPGGENYTKIKKDAASFPRTIEDLTEADFICIYEFINTGSKIEAYKRTFTPNNYEPVSNDLIYAYWRCKGVRAALDEITKELFHYDAVVDNKLVKMITDPQIKDGDRIRAISEYNKLRQRITNLIEMRPNYDYAKLGDDQLAHVIEIYKKQLNKDIEDESE